ncbi:MAG: zinc-dependent metalloprotease, partial [Bacteroidota bacterium]
LHGVLRTTIGQYLPAKPSTNISECGCNELNLSLMRLSSTLILVLTLFALPLLAQQAPICGNEQIQLQERRTDIPAAPNPTVERANTPKYVNTVIHVIYFGETDSIPSEEIKSVLADLNGLFRAEDIDTSLINPVHRDKLMDTQIQFCLAETDPEGAPTTGITYTQTDVDGFPIQFSLGGISAETVKKEIFGGVDPWDVDRYFNIWIANVGDNGENFSYGIPRSEYFPLNGYVSASNIPGAIVDVDNFNAPPPIGTLKSLFAHECGHALGLLHTFHIEGIDTLEFCDGTDFMDDTPTSGITTSCTTTFDQNTCLDGPNDEPDNVTNFMNYACQLMFTPDQIATMHNNLAQAPSGLFSEAPCTIIASAEKTTPKPDIDFNIAPNPNDGHFTINFSDGLNQESTLRIYNATGQVLFEEPIRLQNETAFPINTGILEPGIYYLSIQTERGTASKRMVVQ